MYYYFIKTQKIIGENAAEYAVMKRKKTRIEDLLRYLRDCKVTDTLIKPASTHTRPGKAVAEGPERSTRTAAACIKVLW